MECFIERLITFQRFLFHIGITSVIAGAFRRYCTIFEISKNLRPISTISVAMNAGYMKIEKPLNELLHQVQLKFSELPFKDLISDERPLPTRYKLKCVFLYCCPATKKINIYKPQKGAFKIRHQEVAKYDRFVILGVEGTQHVLLCFTSNGDETKRFLNYKDVLMPGTAVWLISPKVVGYLKNTQTPLISTGDPILPCERGDVLRNPPCDVGNPSYVFFDFEATNLRIQQAVPKDNVCQGKLCDAQGDPNACPCISAQSGKHWALTVTFTCDQLSENVTGEKYVTVTSNQLTKTFIHLDKRSEKLVDDNLDPYDMEDAVIALADSINASQKFRVIGWFKPAQDDEGVASGHFSYHVCSLFPKSPLTPAQSLLLYGAPQPVNQN